MENDCKGCRTYDEDMARRGHKTCCSLGINPCLSETESCPCMTCLVKGMCQKACADLISYAANAADKKHSREAWLTRKFAVDQTESLHQHMRKYGK